MSTLEIGLVCVAALGALVGAVLSPKRNSGTPPHAVALYLVFISILLFFVANLGNTVRGGEALGERFFAALWIVVLPVVLVLAVDRGRDLAPSVPAGLAALALLFGAWALDAQPLAVVAFAGAMALAAFNVRSLRPLGLFCLAGGLVAALAELRAPMGSLWLLGPALLTCVTVALVLRESLASRMKPFLSWAAGAAALALLAWFSFDRVGGDWTAFGIFCAGVALSPGLRILTREASDRDSALTLLLLSVAFVGAAGWAFSLRHGFGMAALLLGGVVSASPLDDRRVLCAWGPVAALVLYRVFVETGRGGSMGIGLEAHYASIGFLLGALLPSLYHRLPLGAHWRGAMTAALVLIASAVAVVFLGQVGAVALLLSSGAGVVAASLSLRGDEARFADRAFLLGGLVGAIAVVGPAVAPSTLARSTKIFLLVGAAIFAALALFVIYYKWNPDSAENME